MSGGIVVRISIFALTVGLVMPNIALGQTSGSFAGVVRDASGAVLPGVTVEASSPALIEKVRSSATDAQGRYSILDLRPGTYVVTFQLPGFRTFVRQGIELTTGFTATVDAVMAVGAVEETVTVSGAAPVVDAVNSRQQRVLSAEVVEILPTGRTTSGLAQLIPGLRATESGVLQQDVGGNLGEGSRLVIHGSRVGDTIWLMNGLPLNRNSADTSATRPDVGAIAEVAYSISANTAEHRTSGVVMNLILKEGGNNFSGMLFANYAGSGMQSSNLDDNLRDRGLASVNALDDLHDLQATLGGPIRQDRLWFFSTLRRVRTDEIIAGVFHDTNLQDFVYTPDLSRPAHNLTKVFNQGARLTWQLGEKHRLNVYASNQPREGFTSPIFVAGQRLFAPEASRPVVFQRNQYAQAQWTSTLSNQLLVEGGATITRDRFRLNRRPEVPVDNYAITDVGRNIAFNAPSEIAESGADANTYTGSMTYVSGYHNFKVGGDLQQAADPPVITDVPHSLNQVHFNGVPSSVTLRAVPRFSHNVMHRVGLYAQDQWRMNRLTLNLGLRFDYINGRVPAQVQRAGRFLSERAYPEVRNVPNFKDVSPRIAGTYDLFGTGRTVLKVAHNFYYEETYLHIARLNNPVSASVNTATRTWTDFNGDFIPDCDFRNPAPNQECGPLSDLAFGTPRITTFYDPEINQGTGKRAYNWESAVSVQQELLPRVGLQAGYFRRSFGRFQVTDNRAVTPTDFDPYCITAPRDSRLPGGGGQEICGLYDVSPLKFGQSDNFVTFAKPFGKQSEVYDGVDIGLSARLANSTFIEGGISSGRVRTDRCFVVDSPQELLFCDIRPPFLTEVKFAGAYTLPRGGVQLSGSIQSLPGAMITATYTARNAEIVPTLGRNLSRGAAGTAEVPLIEPGTLYENRLVQVDFRAMKIFDFGARMRLRAMVDLYNAFNANDVLTMSTGYGATWLRPTSTLPGRLIKVGVQLNY